MEEKADEEIFRYDATKIWYRSWRSSRQIFNRAVWNSHTFTVLNTTPSSHSISNLIHVSCEFNFRTKLARVKVFNLSSAHNTIDFVLSRSSISNSTRWLVQETKLLSVTLDWNIRQVPSRKRKKNFLIFCEPSLALGCPACLSSNALW